VSYGATARLQVGVARDGRPLAGFRVVARRGSSTLQVVQTDAHGIADIAFRAQAPGRVTLEVPSGEVEPITVPLAVAPVLTIRAGATKARRGGAVRISGSTRPAMSGKRIRLMARVDGTWYPLRKRIVTDRRGRFATSVTSSVAGAVAVRVELAAGGGWAAAASNVQVLRIR
jgi:hypothetical protein